MQLSELIESLQCSIVSAEKDKTGKLNGNITCDLTDEILQSAIKSLQLWEDVRSKLSLSDPTFLRTLIDKDYAYVQGREDATAQFLEMINFCISEIEGEGK